MQGPIGLCATVGARLSGASTIITIDSVADRLKMSKAVGADVVTNFKEVDPVKAILEMTGGRGADVAIEALGIENTFKSCLRILKPRGILSSPGVYGKDIYIPLDAFHSGLGDQKIVSTLCPGGKERMRKLINLIGSKKVDLKTLVTHRFKLNKIQEAYELFSNQRDGVLKVAITPQT